MLRITKKSHPGQRRKFLEVETIVTEPEWKEDAPRLQEKTNPHSEDKLDEGKRLISKKQRRKRSSA